MKKKLITLTAILSLIGFACGFLFGVAIALLVCSITGICIGVYKKDKSVWRLFGTILLLDLAGILLFCTALVHSNM